jgi:hypothetical protein
MTQRKQFVNRRVRIVRSKLAGAGQQANNMTGVLQPGSSDRQLRDELRRDSASGRGGRRTAGLPDQAASATAQFGAQAHGIFDLSQIEISG